MERKEIKKLALDIVMYGDDLDPYAFTKSDLVEMALDTYEDLLNGHIENYINSMKDYLVDTLNNGEDAETETDIWLRLIEMYEGSGL